MSDPPWADVGRRLPLEHAERGVVVDLRRCTGCHACSVACKTEHGVPLGEFRLRVRWLPRPDRPTFAFVPVFDATSCDLGENRANHGMQPACVAACPTQALVWGDRGDSASAVAEAAKGATQPQAEEANSHPAVSYVGYEPWIDGKLNRGAALDKRDEDPTYEQ